MSNPAPALILHRRWRPAWPQPVRCKTASMPMTTRPDGTEIAYAQHGAGPAVVLHPGMSNPGIVFPPDLIEPLVSFGHAVLTIDPRDTGASTRQSGPPVDILAVARGATDHAPYSITDMAEDVLGVLDDAGIESATLVGHSMGGRIVAAVRALAPERVTGTVLLSSAPGFGGPPTDDDLAMVFRDAPADREAAIAWHLDFGRKAMGHHWEEAGARQAAAFMVDEAGWCGIPAAHVTAGLVGTPGIDSAVRDEERTLLIYGDEDGMVAAARDLQRALPRVRCIVLAGYGHWFPEPGPWPDIAQAIHEHAS